ncbi:Asp23/Gls24 family envelope stress response protein [Facklamia sp. 7083-14-GEN3]|uniref:Asp23/Gls24 family envelope stress response protein n=1 Tax=Facklamia sp. 7083-14-GEN3 TaxID=2973478 RepID=UPI00215C7BCF|nr:Asp23/Gls24 family envelope stress response protein [Facklamia sp. 7083-14-GEN3]MCR8969327.1 Asp23/Gls24 family envelope stress response protein [Facklamia sp. 7083-14-GEN3]
MSNKQTVSFESLGEQYLGEINITMGVLEDIAAKAASEIDGVLSSSQKKEAGKFLRIQGADVNAKMRQVEDRISIDINVRIAYGKTVPVIAAAIQERVKEQILYMTDLIVSEVNVHVQSIDTEPQMNAALKTIRNSEKEIGE